MQVQKKVSLAIVGLSIVLLISNSVSARVFSNMDKAGGDKAREAQEQSAYAAGVFLMSASVTFEMFSEIEYLVSGREKPDGNQPSISYAHSLCGSAIENLGSAKKNFDILLSPSYSAAFKLINEALDKKLKDTSFVQSSFEKAHVRLESPMTQHVIEEYKNNGTIGLIKLLILEIDKVSSSMGAVYSDLRAGKLPDTGVLWKAEFDWNTTFYMGRTIAAFFTVD